MFERALVEDVVDNLFSRFQEEQRDQNIEEYYKKDFS